MSRDLTEFEKACQQRYMADFKLQHIEELQNIVNYHSFTMYELLKVLAGPKHAAVEGTFHGGNFAFKSNVDCMYYLYYYKDFRYFYCNDDNKDPIRYVIIFPAFQTEKWLGALRKMEKLKVFL